MKTIVFAVVTIAAVAVLYTSWYLFRPLAHHPKPAPFVCLDENDGTFQDIPLHPAHIFGIGLSYAGHIEETAHEFDPQGSPAVFLKANRSLQPGGGVTKIPVTDELIAEAGNLDASLQKTLREKFADLPPLMDYEAELGFILLEDLTDTKLRDQAYAPKLGFFAANDLSARSLQILGEGMPNRLAYWGMSKSLDDFLPVTKKIWVPKKQAADAIPCVTLSTRVNGQLRQSAPASDMIYTPRQMLIAARETYPQFSLRKGDMVIMGTSGGIALSTPRIKARLAELLRFGRLTKLKFILKADTSKFLKPGDTVTVSGGWLGEVTTKLR